MAVENFRLVTPHESLFRKDLTLNDRSLAYPNNANPLLDGEFLELNTTYKAIRSGGDALSWAVWAERGRTDVQSIGKVPVIFIGGYEADTLIMDSAAMALGNPLMVDDVTINSLTKSGLKKHGGGSELVIGYITRLPANNNNKLRFLQTLV